MIDIAGAPADLHSLLGLDTLVVKKKVMVINSVFKQTLLRLSFSIPFLQIQFLICPSSKSVLRVRHEHFGQRYLENIQKGLIEGFAIMRIEVRYRMFQFLVRLVSTNLKE